jgi:hypothetical protein
MHPGHDLMPQEVKDQLPGLDETAELKSSEMPIIVKYFHPATGFTWYIGAGEYDGEAKDWILFGLCDMGYPELGYVCLSQLESCHKGQEGLKALPVERDLHFNSDGTLTLQDAIDGKV